MKTIIPTDGIYLHLQRLNEHLKEELYSADMYRLRQLAIAYNADLLVSDRPIFFKDEYHDIESLFRKYKLLPPLPEFFEGSAQPVHIGNLINESLNALATHTVKQSRPRYRLQERIKKEAYHDMYLDVLYDKSNKGKNQACTLTTGGILMGEHARANYLTRNTAAWALNFLVDCARKKSKFYKNYNN